MFVNIAVTLLTPVWQQTVTRVGKALARSL